MMIRKLRDDCKYFSEEQEFLNGSAQLDFDDMTHIRSKFKKKFNIVENPDKN